MTPFGFIDGSDKRFSFILAALIEFFPEPTMRKFHLKIVLQLIHFLARRFLRRKPVLLSLLSKSRISIKFGV